MVPEIAFGMELELLCNCCPRSNGMRLEGKSDIDCRTRTRRAELRHNDQNQTKETTYKAAKSSTVNHTTNTPECKVLQFLLNFA